MNRIQKMAWMTVICVSTGVILSIVAVTILYFKIGFPRATGGLGFMGLAITISYLFMEDYRRERLFAFLNRSGETEGANFQVTQSLIALGSGNLTGLGLGNSMQKYSYLPEAHTDFIFAIIGEELGLAGTIITVVLFMLFLFFGIKICIKTKDYFGRILAAGLTGIIIVPAIINIFVVTGLAPVTGLTLPFISSGGSSLLVNMIVVGILLNISRSSSETPIRKQ